MLIKTKVFEVCKDMSRGLQPPDSKSREGYSLIHLSAARLASIRNAIIKSAH